MYKLLPIILKINLKDKLKSDFKKKKNIKKYGRNEVKFLPVDAVQIIQRGRRAEMTRNVRHQTVKVPPVTQQTLSMVLQ